MRNRYHSFSFHPPHTCVEGFIGCKIPGVNHPVCSLVFETLTKLSTQSSYL